MFHVVAYAGSVGAGSSYVELTAVTDGVFGTANGRLVYGADLEMFAALATGQEMRAARISTASLRQIAPSSLRPVDQGLDPFFLTWDPKLVELLDHPIRLRANEEIKIEAFHGDASSQTLKVLLWVTRRLKPAPRGDMITIRGASSTSLAGGSWEELTVSWQATLPRGEYAVVGAEVIGIGAVHRWRFEAGGFRPGGFVIPFATARTHEYFLYGRLGLWQTFKTPVFPRVEIYGDVSGSGHTLYLHLIRL